MGVFIPPNGLERNADIIGIRSYHQVFQIIVVYIQKVGSRESEDIDDIGIGIAGKGTVLAVDPGFVGIAAIDAKDQGIEADIAQEDFFVAVIIRIEGQYR